MRVPRRHLISAPRFLSLSHSTKSHKLEAFSWTIVAVALIGGASLFSGRVTRASQSVGSARNSVPPKDALQFSKPTLETPSDKVVFLSNYQFVSAGLAKTSSLQEPAACDGQNFANDSVLPSDSCTGGNLLAMTWVPAQTETISRVEIFTGFSGGTRAPNRLAIWSDDGGSPSQPLAPLAATGFFPVVPTNSWQGADLASAVHVVGGQKYWIVWDPDASQTCSASNDPDGVHLAYWGSSTGTVDGGATWIGPFGQPYNNQIDDRLKYRVFCSVDCPSSLSVDGYAPDFCEAQTVGISVTLNGSNLSGATVNWSLTGPSPNSSLGTGPTLSTLLSDLAPGNYSIVATVSAEGCTAAVATREFTVHTKPQSHAGPDQVFCENSSTTLAGNTPAVGTGTWTLVDGTATIVEPHNPNTLVTDLGYGGTAFRWTVDDGTCQNGDDIVNITRHQPPTVANAGPDQSFCETSSTTLTANAPAIGDAHWELVSGVATITNPFNATTTVTDLGYGTHTFQWVISNGSCEPSIDTITVTRSHKPESNAGPDQVFCENNSTVLAGNTPATGTGTWTVLGGASATIVEPHNPNTLVTDLAYGDTFFRWTVDDGTCQNGDDVVAITRHQPPTVADAGPDQSFCETSSTTLTANSPSVGDAHWELVSGVATITDPFSATTTVTDIGYGTHTFQWVINNGSCDRSIDTMTVTRYQTPPPANAGPDFELCETSVLAISANQPSAGSGMWTIVSGGGTIDNPGWFAAGISNLPYGETILRWTITNGDCAQTSDEMKIIRHPTPVAAAGANQTLCETDSTTMAATAAVTGTGTWTLVSGAGNILEPNNPNTVITGLGYGENKFRWRISNTCATSSDVVKITRDQAPTVAVAGPNQTFCESSTATLAGNTPIAGTGTWILVSGSAIITDPNSPTTTVTNLGYGENVFRWRIKNGSCPASADAVKLTRYQAPTVADAGPDQAFCETDQTTLAGNTPVVGTGTWILVSGSGTIVSPNSPSTLVTNLGYGANVFKWKIDNGSCAASTDKVTVTRTSCMTKLWAGFSESGFGPGGRNVDLRAEVYKNGVLVGTGQLDNIQLSLNFSAAVATLMSISLPAPLTSVSGDTLSFKLLTRLHPAGIFKSDLSVFLWFNSGSADTQFTVVANGQNRTFYLLDQFVLGTSHGPGPRQTITTVIQDGNNQVFVPIGTWSYTF